MPIALRCRNWHIEAVIDGREEEVPADVRELAKEMAKKRLEQTNKRLSAPRIEKATTPPPLLKEDE